MQSDIIQSKLVDFIAENFSVDREEIDLDHSLVDEGIVDSMGLIEVSCHLQKEYGVAIKETDLNGENFGSVVRIVQFVLKKLAPTTAPAPASQVDTQPPAVSDIQSRARRQREVASQRRRATQAQSLE